MDGTDQDEEASGSVPPVDDVRDFLRPDEPKMTGEEEIRLGREMARLTIGHIRQRLDAARAILGLGGHGASPSDMAAASAFLAEFDPLGLEGEELDGRLHDLMFDGHDAGEWIVRRFVEQDPLGALIIRRFVEASALSVSRIAQKYAGCSTVSHDDLKQEGNIGLLKAIPRYDYRRGLRFWTFAAWWVRKNILRAIADGDRTIALPDHIIAEIGHREKAAARLTSELGRRPTDGELARRLEVSPERLEELRIWSAYPSSLDAPSDREDADGDTVISNVAGETDDEQGRWAPLLPSGRERIRASFDRLKPIEADVLRFRFGIDGRPEMTHPEIAEICGLTKQRIQQIEKGALSKLRKRLGTAFDPVV